MNDPIERQAAIDEIKALYEWHDTVTEDRTIDHLKRLPSAQPEHDENDLDFVQPHKRIPVQLVVSSDCISRQAAIDAVKNTDVVVLYHDTEPVEEAIEEAIEATKRSITTGIEGLPSAQPEPHTDDWISRQAAIDAICTEGTRLERNGTVAMAEIKQWCVDILEALPSAQPELSEIKRDLSDLISKQATYLALVEKGQASKRYKLGETWELNGKEIREVLDALPSVQPDLSGYSDRLWKAAYERGKAEAQPDIIHCGECKHRDPEDHKCDCGHDILWQLPREDEWYCADAERRTDERPD